MRFFSLTFISLTSPSTRATDSAAHREMADDAWGCARGVGRQKDENQVGHLQRRGPPHLVEPRTCQEAAAMPGIYPRPRIGAPAGTASPRAFHRRNGQAPAAMAALSRGVKRRAPRSRNLEVLSFSEYL